MNARTLPADDRRHGARTVRAPRGTQRTAKSWLTSAAAHADEQSRPARSRRIPTSWSCTAASARRAQLGMLRSHRRDAARAQRGRNAADSVRQAGRRVQNARGCAARAARQLESGAEVVDLGALQRARPPGPDDVRPDDCGLVDLHRQPGHRAGHARDVRRDGAAALRRQSQGQMDSHGGLGGMGGAQPLAATMAGASILCIEQQSRIQKRLDTRYLDAQAPSLDVR